jgi:poly(hydroxyalkanoate) depolymerase family esterase
VPDFLATARAWLSRLFRREPAPGRWTDGAAFSYHGWIGFRPWLWPRRHYRLYLPRGHGRFRRAPLIVLLHGCHQTPDDFAEGTRIATLADALGALVLMPAQSDAANPYRCWNWFDARTAAGKGEAAIVAKMIGKVSRRHRIDRARVLVAGLSAGGALAATLGLHHRQRVRAVLTHSGLASGAAASAFTALTVMRRGPETDIAELAREAVRATAPGSIVPLLAVQGMADDLVAPRHACALARQYLAANGVDVPAGAVTTLPAADRDVRDTTALPYVTRTREWRRDGRTLVRLVEIESLGHGWSGGVGAPPFYDARGPDATALAGEWLVEATGGGER